MKSLLNALIRFVKREWFLLSVVGILSLIILMYRLL